MSQDTELQFVEYIIKNIVSYPDTVEIKKITDENGTIITIQVMKDDMGRLIGKSGQTVKALRILLRLIGMRRNIQISVKILDPIM